MVKAEKQPELHNEKLEEEIKNFAGDQTKENMVKILQKLSRAVIMQPALFPPGTDPAELKKIAMQGPSSSNVRPRPVMLKNKDGDNFFPIFTSKEQIPEEQKYPAMLFVPFTECVKLAQRTKDKTDIKGIVVNPFTSNLVIHEAAMNMLSNDSQQKKVTMTGAQMQVFLRNQIEMSELPKKFYADKKQFMAEISDKKEELVLEIYHEIYAKVKGLEKACPYQKTDFEMMLLNISDSIQMVRLAMPDKNCVKDQCLQVFFFQNPETDEAIYYTVKKGEKGKPNTLGSISREGKYEEIGDAPAEGSELYSLLDLLPWE